MFFVPKPHKGWSWESGADAFSPDLAKKGMLESLIARGYDPSAVIEPYSSQIGEAHHRQFALGQAFAERPLLKPVAGQGLELGAAGLSPGGMDNMTKVQKQSDLAGRADARRISALAKEMMR